jgi:hypothetical protein
MENAFPEDLPCDPDLVATLREKIDNLIAELQHMRESIEACVIAQDTLEFESGRQIDSTE